VRSEPERQSEVASPERRGFILLLGTMSLLFLAAESPAFASQPGYVLAARLTMSTLLFAAPLLLGRPLSRRAAGVVVHGLGVGVCLSFATIAWGTGGTASPYFAFTPMLPLVFTIAVPVAPLGSLLAGLCAGGVGLARVAVERLPAHATAFWALAFATTTTYAVAGAIFNRRQRARERRLVAERLRAEAILAESERQRGRAERLALVGRLAAGIAHDVSAPLAAVRGAVATLERQLEAVGLDGATPAENARDAVERIRRILEDVRALADADQRGSEDCELVVMAEEARLALAERFRAWVSIARDPSLDGVVVHLVRDRLVHALVWVMADASGRGVRRLRLAATRDGGDVVVDLADDAADLALAPRDLPAATVREAGLALALAREELVRAGCRVDEGAPGEVKLPLRFRCTSAAAVEADEPRPAARVA
jgi:signal transduction histidine kinase